MSKRARSGKRWAVAVVGVGCAAIAVCAFASQLGANEMRDRPLMFVAIVVGLSFVGGLIVGLAIFANDRKVDDAFSGI